jgi:hypothetical protein
VNFVAAGSSALFLQLGLAAGTATTASPAGMGATCVWSQSSGTSYSLKVTDSKSESGNAWIAWTPGSRSQSCTSLTSSDKTTVYAMVSTDSEIGNRLYFNGGTLGATNSPGGGANTNTGSPNQLIFGSSEQPTLPTAIWSALSGKALTAAATDIRPEDAKFASLRALTTGGSAVSSSQYLGLGYSSGNAIYSAFGTSPSHFNVVDFTLPTDGSYAVLPIGAVPVVVAVNPHNTTNGFGTLTFGGSSPANISRTTLAHYLDGTYGYTGDISGSASGAAATILIREPLSGTFNTVEYAVPNTTTLETSQEVGVHQTVSQRDLSSNGTGTVPSGYDSTLDGYVFKLATNDNASAYRERAIGTGQSISELLAVGATDSQGRAITDQLGYAFWSTANYKNATTSTARYLTVDGYDPLYDRSGSSYSTISNTIPTSGNSYLSDVTFADLQNGNYPIWSLLRLVTTSSASSIYNITANKLVYAAQNFVPAGTTTSRPDFVPFSNASVSSSIGTLKVFHSHFAPPGVNFYSTGTNVAANGTSAYKPAASACTDAEAGGDVAGVIGAVNDPAEGGLSESDEAYCSASGNLPTGQTGDRL